MRYQAELGSEARGLCNRLLKQEPTEITESISLLSRLPSVQSIPVAMYVVFKGLLSVANKPRKSFEKALGQDLPQDLAMDVGQSEVAAAVAIR